MIPIPYKWGLYALLVAGVFTAGVGAGLHWSKADVLAEQVRTAQADQARAAEAAKQSAQALADYQTSVQVVNARAVAIQAERDTLAKALDRQRKAYESLPRSSPDCKLSPARLQQLQGAFDAAYSQAAPGSVIAQPTVPAP